MTTQRTRPDIQQSGGFQLRLSGSRRSPRFSSLAGAVLGPGVYVTAVLQKALSDAQGPSNSPNPAGGGVLVLEVDLGRCYTVRSSSEAERMGWAAQGYDSAWAAEGVIGKYEECCVSDPARIRITNTVVSHARQARDIGYVVRSGRLEVASPVRALVTAADNQCVHASYEWKLERLDPLDFLLVTGASATRKPGGLALESPVFQIPTCEGELDSWMLRIFPKGNAESGDHPGVGLYLAVPTTINPEPPYDDLCTELQLRYLHFTLTVVNQRDPSKSIVRELPHAVLGRYMRDWGLRDILQRSALFSPFSGFVVGGTLIVRVDATVLPLALLEETVDKREAARRAAGSDETCAICLDPLEEAAGRFHPFQCRHSFHAQCCPRQGQHEQRRCPVCRAPPGSSLPFQTASRP